MFFPFFVESIIGPARAWAGLHGHLHCPFDYVKNGCRVVANPLGYKGKGEQEGFRPHLLIDIS